MGRSGPGVVVDIGLGSHPWTTLALADRLAAWPQLRLIAVDNDPERLRRAARVLPERVELVLGGTDLSDWAPIRLIRAMNLLRAYRPAEARSARGRLRQALEPGGLLLEGSCSAAGEVGTAELLLPSPTDRIELLTHCRLEHSFAPARLWPYLPMVWRGPGRLSRRRWLAGDPMACLVRAWSWCFEAARAQGLRQPDVLWQRSLQRLAEWIPVRPGPAGMALLSAPRRPAAWAAARLSAPGPGPPAHSPQGAAPR